MIIKVDGSWELKFCKYADAMGLKWKRNKLRFSYIKPDGKSSTYQPDFYVEDWQSYVEVKGYETELDRAKWSQFPENLIILRRKEIGELDELAEIGTLLRCFLSKQRDVGSNPTLTTKQ